MVEGLSEIEFPTESSSVGESEMNAFGFWTQEYDVRYAEVLDFIESSIPIDTILEMSSCLDQLPLESNVTEPFLSSFVFPSLYVWFLSVCGYHLPESFFPEFMISEMESAKFGAAASLWYAGLIPIFDGLTWRLCNRTSILSAGVDTSIPIMS